jgi:hypothetical protein
MGLRIEASVRPTPRVPVTIPAGVSAVLPPQTSMVSSARTAPLISSPAAIWVIPLSPRENRGQPVGGGSVADLAVLVASPGPHVAGAVQGHAVHRARGDLDDAGENG